MPQGLIGQARPENFVDRTTYIAPDGVEYMLSAPVFVLQEDGLGMPPIEYVTQRGPAQHGETVKNFFLRPRIIQLIIRRSGCSRVEYWNIRNALLGILRPGRVGATNSGTLRKFLANGGVRDLLVFTSEGPGFPSHNPDQWDQWSIQDTIRFTAYDPIARDPHLRTIAFQSGVIPGTFPITFPYVIVSGFGTVANVTNAGTWDSAPSIVIAGPIVSPTLRNLTTNEQLVLNYTVPAGRSVTYDLTYGNKTVFQDDGVNLIGYVSTDSDLGTFHLKPGTNSIQVSGSGTTVASSITLQWYDRYIGF